MTWRKTKEWTKCLQDGVALSPSPHTTKLHSVKYKGSLFVNKYWVFRNVKEISQYKLFIRLQELHLFIFKPLYWGSSIFTCLCIKKKKKKKMFELMQVQIPAVWKEHISISKWSEPLHNARSRIFCPWFLFWLSLKGSRRSVWAAKTETLVYLRAPPFFFPCK